VEDDKKYHYSFGPFKSNERDQDKTTANSAAGSGDQEFASVEVSRPRPLRPYSITSGNIDDVRQWSYPVKKRSSFKSMFAAFMAGVLVVGSLMFAADKMNWFTENGVLAAGGSSGGGEVVSASFNGGANGGASTVNAVVRPDTIADMVKKASPAVVKIETYVKLNSRSRDNSVFNEEMFRYFFGEEFPQNPGQPTDENGRRTSGLGSGFIFEKSGYILTNEHVVAGADEIEVKVDGKKDSYKAELLGTAPDLDLAVIKIKGGEAFPTLKLGNSDQIRVGDWVTAIGNPIGFDHTVSVGVLSAKEREIKIPDQNRTRIYKNLLQTDASINPGNSGGPLLNLQGEVIGINTAVSAQAQGIGFAIPTNTVASVLENLKNNVKIPRPFIGVSMQDLQPEWLKELKLDSADGILIRSVLQNSPAHKAGLQPYDVITEINGSKVKNASEFQEKVRSFKVGQKITLTVVRDGGRMTTGLTVGDQNDY
jgi:serine protease Do